VWQSRWSALRSHVDGRLAERGSSRAAVLRAFDVAGDPHLARRAGRMAA
jgi:hypothetical protein